MGDAPEGLVFDEDERKLFLFLMGTEPPEAVPQRVYGLKEPFDTLDHNLSTLPVHYDETVNGINGALPDEVIEQFKQTFGSLLGADGGVNHIDQVRQAAQLMSEQVGEWSRSLLEAQVQIISMLIALMVQLAIMAALAAFTGGGSLGEEAIAQETTRLGLMTIMRGLLSLVKFVMPTAIQAAIGALLMMAASLIASAIDGDPQGPHINWKWVGEGALGGALADLGIRGIGGVFDKVILNNVKNLEKPFLTELTNIGGDFIKMGGGGAIAGTFTQGLIDGHWQVLPMMFVGGGIGGIAFGAAVRGAKLGGIKYRMSKLDINPDLIRTLDKPGLRADPPSRRPGDDPDGAGITKNITNLPPQRTIAAAPPAQTPPGPGGPRGGGPVRTGPALTDPLRETFDDVPPADASFTEVPPLLDENGVPIVQPPPGLSSTTPPPGPLSPTRPLTGTESGSVIHEDAPPLLDETGAPIVEPPPVSSSTPPGPVTRPPGSTPPPETVRTETVTDGKRSDGPPAVVEHDAPPPPPDTTSQDPPPDTTSRGPVSHDTTSNDPPSHDIPPLGHDAVPPVNLVSEHENVTPNFVFDSADHVVQQQLRTGQDAQARRYTERLENEDRRYWRQQEADQHVDAAVAAHQASSTHGVPPQGPRLDPEALAGRAGVPEHLTGPVADVYRTVRTETNLPGDDPAVTTRLAEALETRLAEFDHDLDVSALADRMVREQARVDTDGSRPWTDDVRGRFDARWRPLHDQHLDGTLSRQEFENRFQDLVEGLPDELELEAAVRLVRGSAEHAFDASDLGERPAPAAEARSRARFLAEVESDVRGIADRLGMRGAGRSQRVGPVPHRGEHPDQRADAGPAHPHGARTGGGPDLRPPLGPGGTGPRLRRSPSPARGLRRGVRGTYADPAGRRRDTDAHAPGMGEPALRADRRAARPGRPLGGPAARQGRRDRSAGPRGRRDGAPGERLA